MKATDRRVGEPGAAPEGRKCQARAYSPNPAIGGRAEAFETTGSVAEKLQDPLGNAV